MRFIRHEVRDVNRYDFSTVCKYSAPLELYAYCMGSVYMDPHVPNQAMLQEFLFFLV